MQGTVIAEMYKKGDAADVTMYSLETICLTTGRPSYRRVLDELRGERVLDVWALGSVSSMGSYNRVRERVGLKAEGRVTWTGLDELELTLATHGD